MHTSLAQLAPESDAASLACGGAGGAAAGARGDSVMHGVAAPA